MKIQEVKELHNKTKEELQKLLTDARDALFSLSMEKEQMKLTDTRSLKRKRTEIAQILTALARKENDHA